MASIFQSILTFLNSPIPTTVIANSIFERLKTLDDNFTSTLATNLGTTNGRVTGNVALASVATEARLAKLDITAARVASIKSIQDFTVTFTTTAASATATLTSYTVANAVIIPQGIGSTDNTGNATDRLHCRFEKTNSTTVTVYRQAGNLSGTLTVSGTLIEFYNVGP